MKINNNNNDIKEKNENNNNNDINDNNLSNENHDDIQMPQYVKKMFKNFILAYQ